MTSRAITHADLQDTAAEVFVCGDSIIGCGQRKGESGFYQQRKGGRGQPNLCDECLNHRVVTYGVAPAHAEILILLIHQEVSLFRQARTLAKPADITDKLKVMKAGHQERLRDLTRAVIEAMRTHGSKGIEMTMAVYRKHWFEILGMKLPAAGNTEMKTLARADVPVGDRA